MRGLNKTSLEIIIDRVMYTMFPVNMEIWPSTMGVDLGEGDEGEQS